MSIYEKRERRKVVKLKIKRVKVVNKLKMNGRQELIRCKMNKDYISQIQMIKCDERVVKTKCKGR